MNFPIPWKVFKNAFLEFNQNEPIRMAGAVSFFTTFALPALMLIMIQILGIIFDQDHVSEALSGTLEGIIGQKSTHQVNLTLEAFLQKAETLFISIFGFLFLLFVATTLFKVINGSINQIWKIRVNRKISIKTIMVNRLKSALIILVTGILFMAGIFAETAQAFLGEILQENQPEIAGILNPSLNILISLIVVTAWFAVLFRYLPDGKPEWKVAIIGALVTGVLFNAGKFILRILLVQGNIGEFYGAAGSFVLLLLFVFYSSLILFYGAAFTKIWAEYKGMPIQANPYAFQYRIEVEDRG